MNPRKLRYMLEDISAWQRAALYLVALAITARAAWRRFVTDWTIKRLK